MALLQSPPPLAVSLSLGKAGDAVSCFTSALDVRIVDI